MKKIASLLSIGLCLLVLHGGGQVRAAEGGAESVVRDATQSIYTALDQQCQTIRDQPEHLFVLVEEILLPHVDFEIMSQWVLGKFWRQANELQRQAFTQEFRHLLVRTYATAIQLASLEDIHYLPARGSTRPDRSVVRAEVRRPGEAVTTIAYSMRLNSGRWLVYDIVVDGVSLVSNYRTSFAEEIGRQGLSGLIASLEQKNRQKISAETADQIRRRQLSSCNRKTR
ncbi:MlaC/ttg2D family ABC transporter substrate-binding protein [Thiogranum longum]